MTEAELRALADRREVEELLHRFAWMLDRREWALMEDVFAPGATARIGSLPPGYATPR